MTHGATQAWQASSVATFLMALTLAARVAWGAPAADQPARAPAGVELEVTVLDENGVAVPSARLTISPKAPSPALHGETDYKGRKRFTGVVPGLYSLEAEKEGFFAVTETEVHVGEETSLEVTLNHVQEFSEQVNVVYSPPAIDPAKIQSSETLTNEQIIDLPFTTTRDIRYALPLLPGVLQDYTGQVHVDGSSTRQISDLMDGFDLSDPVTGTFLARLSVDALRSVEVAGSRYSTEFGKGSGGIISVRTGMGDDHWRVTATDFLPGFQSRKGFNLNNWTPRGLFSGPIRKGKAWFMDAWEGEYDLNIFQELPAGADRASVWRGSNLAKAQFNLAPRNNLTVSLLVNYLHSPHSGLDPLDPISTTQNYSTGAFMLAAKDQHLFGSGVLLELGVAASRFNSHAIPMGTETYILTPGEATGNYYATSHSHADRTEVVGNLFLKPWRGAGKHEVKLGFDADRVSDTQRVTRLPYRVEREDGTLSRRVDFRNGPPFTRVNDEGGIYVQDHWNITGRWLVEPGVRFDWDEIVRAVAPSPRLASTVLLNRRGGTKLSWGTGVYRDPSNLDILTRSLTGIRTDSFYDAAGQNLIRAPIVTNFTVNQDALRFSQLINSSVALEQKLLRTTYLRLQLLDKRGRDIWTFVNSGASTSPTGLASGQFLLTNNRHDRYDAAELTLRHVFHGNHEVFTSYTRSRAHSNAVFNYSIDAVLFGPQAGGPLAWDTPNRFQSWGWLPLTHKVDFAYAVDWRDGFPFTLQNDTQEVVGAPGSRRFPEYFTLNLSLERRFTFFGFQWALRGGLDNVTGRHNPTYVDSNIDSPHFLTFSGYAGRSFSGRIRLLGRK